MRKIVLYSLLILLFSACSFKSASNQWQLKSTNAFNSYTKNFLSAKDILAKGDYNRAVNHAKSSSDLTTLAKIYLGKCTLNISLGKEDKCSQFTDIRDVVNSDKLEAYYSYISSSLQNEQILLLPKAHIDFAQNLHKSDFISANNNILEMPTLTSKLLAASLLKKNLLKNTREKILEEVSFHGYKKAVLFYLDEIQKNSNNKNEKYLINKKITILKSKS